MNWFANLFRKAASKLFSFAPEFARYAFSQFTARQLVSQGYKANSAVSACATTLQLTFPEPPLLAGYEEEGRFIPDYKHPITALLQKPNPDMGMAEFLQFAITYNPIGGNAYIWKQRSASRKVVALWIFSDLQITPVAGRNTSEGLVRHYEYDPGDGNITIIPKEDIIQWKWMIDPEYPFKGIGAIALSAREVDKDSEATAYIFALLKNNAVPPLVVNLEEDDDSTQEEIDAMGRKWIQKHSKGQPAFIGAGMKVTQLGYDLNKLAGDSLADVPETRIAANFHVPPSVAGLNVGVKRSDYGDSAARKAFTEQTLMALWRSFASEMLNGLKDEFPGTPANFTLQFDIKNVGALQELKKDLRTSINELWKSGLLTRAESKRELGIKPIEGDEVYYVSLATEFVPAKGRGTVVRDPQKLLASSIEKKARRQSIAESLLKVRKVAAGSMVNSLDAYFAKLANNVVDRAEGKGLQGSEQKAKLPDANDLLDPSDDVDLEKLIKRFYVRVIELSWDTWNVTLGIEKAFDLSDPAVTRALEMAGEHVQEIQGTTKQALIEALQHASENGWSIDQLVRGDGDQPGLRDIIEETYKNRSRAVAISELGHAQNAATAERYKDAGVEKVEILDGGADDSAPACELANGQIWTVDLFEANPMQHPNCSRAAAPYFGDDDPITQWNYGFGDRG